jgi:predicted ATPase
MVRDVVRVESLSPVEGKGKARPVNAYRLVAIGAPRAPMAERAERPLSRFVGREGELATLRDLLVQAERGHGQIVGLVGEPGAGKSRLLYEFRQGPDGRAFTYLEGRCLSWGRAIPYLPILDIVRGHCGVAEADPPEAIADKIAAALREVDMDPAEASPYILHLLGVKDGTKRLEALTAHALKERTFETLRQMVVGGSRLRPLVLGVEDLHWVDATSEEYLGALADGLAGVPILLVVTYRPGYRMAWVDKSYATQIALRPLSAEDGLAMVRSVLGEAPATGPVARAILAKAEGNPFFIEELSRTVLDHPELGQP